jgi:uncharacterized coiled-coil protein SlyX
MANEQQNGRIEAWLKGELPAAEAAAFEAEVAADPALAEEVELQRLTLSAMEHLSEQHLQQNILGWMNDVEIDDAPQVAKKNPGSEFKRNLLWVAVALLLLIGSLVYFISDANAAKRRIAALEAAIRQQDSVLFELKQRPTVDSAGIDSLARENRRLQQELKNSQDAGEAPGPFAYYRKPKDLGAAVRLGEDPSVTELLRDGARFFQKSDLKRAEDNARAALKIDPENRDADRLLAHVLFGQRRFFEAEPIFARLREKYALTSDLAREAEWNLLLCYRALAADTGQRALFNAALDKILNERDHPYHSEALKMKAADRNNEK